MEKKRKDNDMARKRKLANIQIAKFIALNLDFSYSILIINLNMNFNFRMFDLEN